MTIYREVMNLSDISAVEAEVAALLNRPIESVADLEAWLTAEEDFGNRFIETMAGILIDFYCHTDDEERNARHLKVQTEVVPAVAKLQAEPDRKFTDCPYTKYLDERRYGVLRTSRLNRVGLFRNENLPLIAREQELAAEYSSIIGGRTAEWEGEQQPLPSLSKHMASLNRDVRERAWRSIRAACRGVADQLDVIMDNLVRTLHHMKRTPT